MGLGVSGKVPELSFEESAGFFLPGNIVGGGSWKILVGSFIPGKSCVWRGFKSRIKPVRGRPRDCGKWRFVQYKARRGSNCKAEKHALGSAARGRRDGKHVHWECDVEVGVGKADVHWPHACLGTESG